MRGLQQGRSYGSDAKGNKSQAPHQLMPVVMVQLQPLQKEVVSFPKATMIEASGRRKYFLEG